MLGRRRRRRCIGEQRYAGLLLGVGVESAVVVVSDLDIGAKAEDGNGVGDEPDVAAGGEPELVVDELLIEGEVAALSDGEEAEAGVDIAVEPGDEAADFAVLLIDPDGAGGVAGGLFSDAVSFGVGIAGEIEDDSAAIVEHEAARAGEAGHGKDAADADDDFSVGSLAGRRLLGFFDVSGDAVLFFLLLVGVEFFTVPANKAADLVAVDVEDFVLFGVGLFDAAVLIEFVDKVGLVEGVIFLDGIHLALVIADLIEECGDIRNGRGGRLRRGKHGQGEGQQGEHEEKCGRAGEPIRLWNQGGAHVSV